MSRNFALSMQWTLTICSLTPSGSCRNFRKSARNGRRKRGICWSTNFRIPTACNSNLSACLASGKPPNVCVVGDDDQSIYGWRGAEVSNILEFENHFPNPRIIRLEQNYRSTNSILSAANRLIAHNPRRHPKRLWCPGQQGESVRVIAVPDDRTEAEFVTHEVAALCPAGSASHKQVAVIYRMNAQSRLLEENFRRLRIPYRLVGGRSFFERREIKDLTAYITVLLNPSDDRFASTDH